MKFCDEDFLRVVGNVERLGLGHLRAKSQESSDLIAMRFSQGVNKPIDYDPVLGCLASLSRTALAVIGPSVNEIINGIEKCPACELRNYDWTEGAARVAYAYARENGLLLNFVT